MLKVYGSGVCPDCIEFKVEAGAACTVDGKGC
jgi:glutaredoxin-related protein